MSATEDEQQSVDAGWDDEEPSSPGDRESEEDVDAAWDSLPPPVSAADASVSPSSPSPSARPSLAPVTEEVDSGWDDVPAPGAPRKRRPHRERRAKSNVVVASASLVLSPRPAEPSKKQQREHARQQRAKEAQVKQARKVEKKSRRAAEAREAAEARARRIEVEEQARREARARAEAERPKVKPVAQPKPAAHRAKRVESPVVVAKHEPEPVRQDGRKSALRPGVVITLLAIAIVVALLLLRK
jgi:hypothetical protein